MREYLNLNVPKGGVTVSVKLDDEGVVIDVIDIDGDVIASTWKTYDEFEKQVTPLELDTP